MKFTNTKKVLALLSFVSLLTAFILYRTGVFDTYIYSGEASLQSSSNGGAMNNNRTDTSSPQKKDTVLLTMPDSLKKNLILWSGSKSGHIIEADDFKKLAVDTIKRVDSSTKKTTATIMMSGSKSGRIFKPNDIRNPNADLIRIIKLYQNDSVGLKRALEKYFRRKN